MLDVKSIVMMLILAYVAFNILTKKLDLLDAFVVLLPFKSISFELGLNIYAFQIPILLLLFKRGSVGKNFKTFFNNDTFLVLFLLYVLISTVIISNFFIIDFIKNDYYEGFFRGEGRYLSILVRFIFFDFGIVYLAYIYIKDELKVYRLIKLYLKSLLVLAILGLIQVVLSSLTGTDIFPNVFDEAGNVRTDFVSDAISSLPFVRLTSLGGEPKSLASSLSVGIMLLVFINRQKVRLFNYQNIIIWFFLICIILSLSTSGFGLLFLLLIMIILTGSGKESFWQLKKRSFIAIPILLIVITYFSQSLSKIFETRILERSNEFGSEEVDEIIQVFLISNPNWAIFGSGSGNIHNLVNTLLSEQSYAQYLQGNIFVSRYGYMKLISENGIVGFLLFIIAFGNILLRLSYSKHKLTKVLYYSLLTMLFFFFARANYVISEMMFIAGLAIADLSILKQKIVVQ